MQPFGSVEKSVTKIDNLNHPSALQYEKNENELENEKRDKILMPRSRAAQLCNKNPLCLGLNEAGPFALGQMRLASFVWNK